jgi:hypothetical protein
MPRPWLLAWRRGRGTVSFHQPSPQCGTATASTPTVTSLGTASATMSSRGIAMSGTCSCTVSNCAQSPPACSPWKGSRGPPRDRDPATATAVGIPGDAASGSRRTLPTNRSWIAFAHRHPHPAPAPGTRTRHPHPAPGTGTRHRHPAPAPGTRTRHPHPAPAPGTGTRTKISITWFRTLVAERARRLARRSGQRAPEASTAVAQASTAQASTVAARERSRPPDRGRENEGRPLRVRARDSGPSRRLPGRREPGGCPARGFRRRPARSSRRG